MHKSKLVLVLIIGILFFNFVLIFNYQNSYQEIASNLCSSSSYSPVQLTNNMWDDANPQIHNGMVTWVAMWDFDIPHHYDINLYDGSSIQYLSASWEDINPSIHNGMVTWQGGYGTPYDNAFDIYLYDGTSIQRITNNYAADINPQIHNGMITWSGRQLIDGEPEDYEIFLYDGNSIQQLIHNYGEYAEDDLNPQIHNGIVTWMGFDLNDFEIFLYDGISVQQLTNNEYEDSYPQIHNGMVTWNGWDGNDYEIFLYDGSTVQQLTNNEYEDSYPQIHNGMITWSGYDGNDYEIFLYDCIYTQQITDNMWDDFSPEIHNGIITWKGFDGNDYEIFLYDGISIHQLSNNEYNDQNAKIHNYMVTWEGFDGKDYEIFLIEIFPPETSIEVHGICTLDGWYYPDVEVSLWAEDPGTGVAYTEYSFNGVNWIQYSGSFTISDEGTTTIYYRSVDNFGNVEEIKIEVIEIHQRPAEDPIVIYGMSGGPEAIDPHNGWDINSYDVIEQVIETLFAYDLTTPDMNIIPRLALDYGTWSIDGLTYTVPLKTVGINGEPITFHDGAYFNAWAVKWSFDRLMNLMNSENPPSISPVFRWSDGTPIIDHVEAVNDYTVKFVLTHPFAALEALLCFSGSGILSPISTPFDNYIDTFSGELVGTGPFIYEEYISGTGIRFYSNDQYWQGSPSINELWFLIIQEINERNDALLKGYVDLITDPLNSMLDTFEADPNINVEGGQGTNIYYLSMNNNKIDTPIRQAISYAIDYSYLIEEIYGGAVERLRSPIPEGIRYGDWSYNVATMDIMQARTILVEEGICDFNILLDEEWLDAVVNDPLASYVYSYNPESFYKEALGYSLKDTLAYIGIKLELEEIPWSNLLYKVFEDPNSLDMFTWAWVADYNDPSNFANLLLSADSIYNTAQVSDPYLQDLLDQGYLVIDPIERENIYKEIQRYCIEELMPWAYLYVNLQNDAYNSKIIGFQWNPMGKVYFYPLYLSPRYIDNMPPTVIYDTIPNEIKITYTRSTQILGTIKTYDRSSIVSVGWDLTENLDPGFSLSTTYNELNLEEEITYFSETVLMTTTLLEPGIHSLNLMIVDEHLNAYVKSFTVEVYRIASLDLRGEFDYIEKEKIKISIAAQVFDLEEMYLLIPSEDLDFTVHISILDYNGVVKVADELMEYNSNGFFHWDSILTINEMKDEFPKGIYIVQGWVEFSDGSFYEEGNDVIQFHIDPPSSNQPNTWLFLETLTFGGLILLSLALALFYLRERHRHIEL